jgi:hypothetical protein
MIEIPVPPFADLATAKRFHALLLLYLSEMKRPGEPVGLSQFLLAEALSWHAPRGGPACAYCDPPSHSYLCFVAGDQPGGGAECARCGPPFPCRTLMSVAAVSRFPAPWTPLGLAAALKSTGLIQSWGSALDDDARLHWGGDGWTDPIFTAERDAYGAWVLTRVERSNRECTQLADDGQLCERLFDFARTFPYPYGSHVEPAWLDAVKPGVASVESWWTTHLSRLEHYRPDGAFTSSA